MVLYINAQRLREKCPNTEFFMVRIQSECGKYGIEKTLYLDTFQAVKETNSSS